MSRIIDKGRVIKELVVCWVLLNRIIIWKGKLSLVVGPYEVIDRLEQTKNVWFVYSTFTGHLIKLRGL